VLKLEESKTRPQKILWLDLETGGLELERQPIIEVAAIVAENVFEQTASFHRIIFASEQQIKAFEPEATRMHRENGLLEKLKDGLPLSHVESELIDFCKSHFQGKKIILAGNSVHWDRAFLVRWMPKFSQMLSHRILDVSSWKTYFQIQYGKEPKKLAPHLAMTDIELSMDELRLYASFFDTRKIATKESADESRD